MLGMVPVPFPHVTTGWQRPPCARSAGRYMVKATGAPPSVPTPAGGPTLFSVMVANGPGMLGSAAGQAPMLHVPPAPASTGAPPPLPPVRPAPPLPPLPPVLLPAAPPPPDVVIVAPPLPALPPLLPPPPPSVGVFTLELPQAAS